MPPVLLELTKFLDLTITTPPQIPVTILDLERTEGYFEGLLPMADPCPHCGGFNMKVGDWVCWGLCFSCYTLLSNFED